MTTTPLGTRDHRGDEHPAGRPGHERPGAGLIKAQVVEADGGWVVLWTDGPVANPADRRWPSRYEAMQAVEHALGPMLWSEVRPGRFWARAW